LDKLKPFSCQLVKLPAVSCLRASAVSLTMQKIAILLASLACVGCAYKCSRSTYVPGQGLSTLLPDVDEACCAEWYEKNSTSTCILGKQISIQISKGDPAAACTGDVCHVDGALCGYPWFESGTDFYGLTSEQCSAIKAEWAAKPEYVLCSQEASCYTGTGFPAGGKEKVAAFHV